MRIVKKGLHEVNFAATSSTLALFDQFKDEVLLVFLLFSPAYMCGRAYSEFEHSSCLLFSGLS